MHSLISAGFLINFTKKSRLKKRGCRHFKWDALELCQFCSRNGCETGVSLYVSGRQHTTAQDIWRHMGMVGGPVSYYWHDLSGNLFEKAKSIPSEGANLDSFVTHFIVMMRWKEGADLWWKMDPGERSGAEECWRRKRPKKKSDFAMLLFGI